MNKEQKNSELSPDDEFVVTTFGPLAGSNINLEVGFYDNNKALLFRTADFIEELTVLISRHSTGKISPDFLADKMYMVAKDLEHLVDSVNKHCGDLT